MRVGRRGGALATALIALLVGGAACSSGGRGGEAAHQSGGVATTSTTATASAPPAEEPADAASTTVMADRLAAVTTEAPAPRVALEVRLVGTVSGAARGDVAARCLRGPGFLDVDVVAEPPLAIGAYGVTSLVFSAPGYRGAGRYDAGAADDEEWAIALVDLETEEPLEFFSPGGGVVGSITVDADERSGAFDIRGLVDVEERPITISGRFTCGSVEG